MSASRVSPYQFVTLRTYQRTPLLEPSAMKQRLLDCFMDCKRRYRLVVAGYVVLNDHAHFLFNTPVEHTAEQVMDELRTDFMRSKRRATPLLEREHPNNTLFWEQAIEYRSAYSPDDLRAYLDFIHYDPVRHELVTRAADYEWSSLPVRIAQGHYAETWADLGPPAAIARVMRECDLSRVMAKTPRS